MTNYRTDLALETAENLVGKEKFSSKDGVRITEQMHDGYEVTALDITNDAGARQMEKPIGRYVTIDLQPYFRRQSGFFSRGAQCLAQELTALLPSVGQDTPTMVVGLGNRAMTADAVGAMALENILVTRHMVKALPLQFHTFTPVSALATSVTGCTGLETLELVQGVAAQIKPAAVIVIDALAARERKRLCATVQLSDTGLIPGSGVGNHRAAINKETLGVPVIAVGLPTVISTSDLGDKKDEEMFLTTRDIDQRVRELSRLIGYGITLALQPALTLEDVTGLLG